MGREKAKANTTSSLWVLKIKSSLRKFISFKHFTNLGKNPLWLQHMNKSSEPLSMRKNIAQVKEKCRMIVDHIFKNHDENDMCWLKCILSVEYSITAYFPMNTLYKNQAVPCSIRMCYNDINVPTGSFPASIWSSTNNDNLIESEAE